MKLRTMPRETTTRRTPAPAPASRVAALPLLLFGGLLLRATPAAAQRVAPAADALEEQAAARVADAVCGKRVVLLGELPEHGEARGMGVKARIVRHLVTRCGFDAVLFEAGSYDFFGLERAIAATPRAPADSLELALARAIGGLWWTRELAGWRQWLVQQAAAGRVVIGGIDDQPGATAAYAKRALDSKAAGDAAGWTYLDRAALRALGALPSRLFGQVTTTDWSAAFDGVLVLRDEAAPTFEPRR